MQLLPSLDNIALNKILYGRKALPCYAQWDAFSRQNRIKTNTFAQRLILSGFALICTSTSNAYASEGGAVFTQLPSVETAPSVETKYQHACAFLPSASLFARTELFFGSLRPNGSHVSDTEFQTFLGRKITPLFPDGLTLLTGLGQFKNSQGVIIREKARQLILLYPINTVNSSNLKIEQIRTAYKSTFQQESVLRTDNVSCVSL